MAGPWEEYAAPAAKEPAVSAGPWDAFKPTQPAAEAAVPKPLKRTLRQAASDMGASVVEGTGQLLGGMAELTNVATGGIADKVVRKAQGALNRTLGGVGGDGPGITGAYAGLQEEVEGEKSEVLRTKQRELADTKGFIGSAKKVLSDPTLLTAELAKQLPNLAIMGGGAAPTLARGLAGAEARGLTGAAAETAARRTLERQIVGTAAVQEAGPAALQARQAVEALPQDVWDTNPDYQRRVAAGEAAEDVKASMGQWAATKAAVIGGIAGAAGGKLTAGLEGKFFTRGLEKASGAREFATDAVKAVGREAAEEAIQEGGSQIGSNVGVQGVDASQGLLEGVPEAAGTGAALGGVMGGGISVVNPVTSRTMPDGQPLPDPAAGVLSRTVNIAADSGALAQAAAKQANANEAAALEGRANDEDPRPIESRMPARPWVDENTGVGREPTDDEIKLTLHRYLEEVERTGSRIGKKAVTASLAVGGKRSNTLLDRVINERKNGITAETYAAQQNEVSDASSAGRSESEGTAVGRAVDDGGSRSLFDPVQGGVGDEATGSATTVAAPAPGFEQTADEDPDAELAGPYQVGASPERTADVSTPEKRPPTNLDPSTGELLGIDAEAWPAAPAHQQPKAIIAAIAAQGRANEKKKPPGITLISETYGVDLNVARALRDRAVRQMTSSVSAAGASQNVPAASASMASDVPAPPGAADATQASTSARGSEPAARAAVEAEGEAGALATAPVGDAAQDTPAQAEGRVYDESDEVQDDDITPSSGGAFTARGAADIQAKRHPDGKVFAVAGGFVVRTPKAAPANQDLAEAGRSVPETSPAESPVGVLTSGARAAAELRSESKLPPSPAAPSSVARPSPQATPAPTAGQAPKVRIKAGKPYYQDGPDTAAAYFKPGDVVPSYGGDTDRVVSFKKDDGNGWSVRVIAVNKDGTPKSGAVEREHSTFPLPSEIVAKFGRPQVPVKKAKPGAAIAESAAAAATSPTNELSQPTQAQKEAGNYRKGHHRIAGLDVSIENPKGTRRQPEWPPLANHYGYFRGTIGKDKDYVDVFLTDSAEDPSLPVFVIDQVDEKGKYDEAKVVMGAANEAAARKAYLSNYPKGWTGLGGITQMTQDEFKAWVRDPSKTLKRAAAKNAIPMAEVSASTAGDRRSDPAARARVAALPADEQKAEIESLRTQLAEANKRADIDARTGLKNPGAFDREVDAAGGVAMIDLKLFKGYNTLLTDKGGDAVLAAVGEAMRAAGGDTAYRRGGDEFAFLAADTKAAEAMLSRFSDRAAAISLTVQVKDTVYTVTGVPFTAGVGTDEESAIAARDASKGDYDRNALPENVRANSLQGDAGAAPAGASRREGDGRAPAAAEVGKTPKAADKIEDFGETLHGARKHYAHAYGDRFKEALTLDLAANPLSKTWPEPDYGKLLEVGTDPFVVGWIHAARAEIPTKPTSSWKLRGWVGNVETLRGMADRLLTGDITPERLREALAKPEFVRVNEYIGGRAELYQAVGHDVSLKGVSLLHHHYSLYHGRENVKLWAVEKKAKATAFSNWPNEMGVGDTKEQAIEAFRGKLGELEPMAKEKGSSRFVIYSYRGQNKFVIGKKIGKQHIDLETFDTAKLAREYLGDHFEELEAKLKKMTDIPQERRASNEPRIGVDHRSGADVKPEQFAETFGFRGVQFGNYVEGSRRQQDLNNAYDALLDMAGVLGVPPRALSLNGTLGLAFGARGKGGKNAPSAHYEPTNIVINLTKGAGAGSLAHEWWHGLDNYFGVMRAGAGKFGRADTYATESARVRADLGPASEGNLRPELMRAFTRVANMVHETGIRERSALLDKLKRKAYWSTGREMTARSFESYVIARLADQNAANDYLANVISEESFAIENGYPYPTAAEFASVRGAYDDFFKTIENEETTEGNVRLFSKAGRGGSDRADWGDFPPTVIGYPFGPEQRRLSSHADYLQAKAGDVEAAARLVDDFLSDDVVAQFRELIGDRKPIIAAVTAEEESGTNKIPDAFAEALAHKLGLKFDTEIVQTVLAHHTNAGAYHRMAFQPVFDGQVQSGQDYLIVDDAVTIGGTLANLRGHIEANGGNVVGAGVLTGHTNSANMAIQDATAQRLQKEFGDELDSYLQEEFGFGVAQLTEGEAGHIRAAKTVDEFRNRIAQARKEAVSRLPPGTALSRPPVTTGPPKAGRSTSGGLSFDLALKLKKELTAKWGDNAPNVILVQSAEDFPVSAKTDPDFRRGEGFYEGRQTVWINVGRIRSSQRFAQVLAHEAIGHYGVERIVGEAQWDGIVDTVERLVQTGTGSAQTRAVIAEVRARYPDVDRVTFAKEAIAVMAEKGIRNSIVERVVAAVRRWLRAVMPTLPWRELDVRSLLSQADSFLRVGQAREQAVRTVQAYSFARGGVLAKVDGRGQRTIEMGGETFADRSGKFYMINGTGQPKDIRSLGEATELAKRTGGEVLVDDAIEGERPSWSVVVPDIVARDAFSNRPLFSKASAEGEYTSGPDPTRPFAPTLDLNDLSFDKRPLSYAIKGGLDWLKKNAWLPMMPANYLLDYARPGQEQPARFMAIKDEMDSLRGELHAETNEHSQKWLDYHIAHRQESRAVMDLMHDSTLAGTDPSEAYAPLQFRYSGKDWPATYANVKAALKAINEQIRGRAGDKKGTLYENREAIKTMGEAEKTRPAKHKALQERFNQLSDAGKALFTSTRDIYKNRDELFDKTLIEGIEKEMEHAVTRADRTHEKLLKSFEDQGLTGAELATSKKRAADKHLKDQSISHQKRAARLKEMREVMESNRLQSIYFPITRFGDYFVTVRDATKKVVGFSKFESSGEQQWYADQLAKKMPDLRVETGLMSNKDQVRGAVDAGFVADIEEMLDGQGASAEMLDGVWQRYLESLPDFSIRKQFIHRKGTAGYQQDALRSFGSTMFHSAHQIAKLKHGSDLAATVDLMREESKDMDDPTQAGMLANEFEHRLKWVMNPTGSSAAQKITSTAFVWNLAISPAAAAVNWTQTPMLGIPILGARLGGMTKAAAALLRASADLVRSKGWHVENSLQGSEKTAMEAFFRAGLLDRTYSHAVAGIGDSGVAYSAVRERVMQKMSFLFHHLERINRETTALAAYRMALDYGMEHAEAVNEAMMLTKKIHFDMSNSSRSRALTSDAAKVMMVHRAHSLNMSIRLLRDVHQMFKGETPEARTEARKQFTGIIGMHALFAGVMGVPFYGIAMMVAGLAKDAFGDDDDDRTPEDVLKGWFYEAMPKEIADIVLYGAPSTSTGLSLYNRIGFPDLFFRSAGRELEGRSEAEYWINQLIGPAFGMAAQVWSGLDLVRQGELWRGTEAMIPKGLRDVMRSTRYAREGVLTLNDDPVVDELNAWEMIGQGAGFVPFVVSEAYEQRGAKLNLQSSIQRRKTQAMNRYALAYRQRDPEIMQDAAKMIHSFNRAYPELAITPASIKSSMRQRERRSARNQTGGLVIEKRLEGRIERELGY